MNAGSGQSGDSQLMLGLGWCAIRRRLADFGRREDGVSGIEFGLFAPILFFSLLAMVDLGFALFERMTIDHVLRAGAQSAIAGDAQTEILEVLSRTAERNFVLADGTQADSAGEPLSVSVHRYNACPENPSVEVAPSTVCAGPSASSIFYRISGGKTYGGMLLPAMTIGRSIVVQVR